MSQSVPKMVSTEKVNESRSKAHDIVLNVHDQVERKILHAGNSVMRVEVNEEEIKIKTNSGSFKALSEEIIKLNVGDKIEGTEATATVRDHYEQTDINKIPYMVKTEFFVTNVKTGESGKAVLHTYLTQTYFMVQGNKIMQGKVLFKDFFYQNILQKLMHDIMEKKRQEIRFMNKFLKSQTRTVNPKQWKRKQTSREDTCDICSQTFVNKQGVNIHKKKVHGISVTELTKTRISTSLKLKNGLTRTESVKSVNGSSRSNSPPPKKETVKTRKKTQIIHSQVQLLWSILEGRMKEKETRK